MQAYFTADNQGQFHRPRRLPGPNDPGQGAFVSDRQGLVALQTGALEQFLGAGGTALETEVRQAVQFGVGRWRAHANQPCSHSGPSSPRLR
ncbi:hypothetical protein D3C80_584830 [compost metagenome]